MIYIIAVWFQEAGYLGRLLGNRHTYLGIKGFRSTAS